MSNGERERHPAHKRPFPQAGQADQTASATRHAEAAQPGTTQPQPRQEADRETVSGPELDSRLTAENVQEAAAAAARRDQRVEWGWQPTDSQLEGLAISAINSGNGDPEQQEQASRGQSCQLDSFISDRDAYVPISERPIHENVAAATVYYEARARAVFSEMRLEESFPRRR